MDSIYDILMVVVGLLPAAAMGYTLWLYKQVLEMLAIVTLKVRDIQADIDEVGAHVAAMAKKELRGTQQEAPPSSGGAV